VLETSRAREALPLGEHYEADIHLLVTDVVMPAMSGPELADRLKAARQDMKVLYLSGYTQDGTVRKRLLQPGANLLSKPFGPAELGRRVRRVLDEAEGPQESEGE
jgi:DNA-binding response OmpR family regulator